MVWGSSARFKIVGIKKLARSWTLELILRQDSNDFFIHKKLDGLIKGLVLYGLTWLYYAQREFDRSTQACAAL